MRPDESRYVSWFVLVLAFLPFFPDKLVSLLLAGVCVCVFTPLYLHFMLVFSPLIFQSRAHFSQQDMKTSSFLPQPHGRPFPFQLPAQSPCEVG